MELDGVCQLLLDSSDSKLEGVIGSGTHTDSIYKPVCLSSCWNFTAPVKVVQATMAAIEETELQPRHEYVFRLF